MLLIVKQVGGEVIGGFSIFSYKIFIGQFSYSIKHALEGMIFILFSYLV